MRIVFMCTSGLGDPSPSGRWLPIGEHLTHAGHEVHLLLLHPTFDRPEGPLRFDCRGVHVCYVAQMHVYGHPGRRRYFSPPRLLATALRSSLALARAARELRPDAIHVAKPQPINGLAALLARKKGARLYVDCDDLEAGANRFSGRWQQWGVRWWEDHLPRWADAVSVNTRFLFERCRRLGVRSDCLFYVPNGVSDVQFARPDTAAVAGLRQRLDCYHRSVIVYFGSMHQVAHGLDLLLDGFSYLHAAYPAARLLMIGDGDDLPVLRRRAHHVGIAGSTMWIGRVPTEMLPVYLALADCSVDPVYDTPAARARSPLKIVESLAQGVPVVTGDVGDRRAMLDDGRAGVLVPPGDAAALGSAFQTILAYVDQRLSMSVAARKRAESFRWERLVRDWVGMYCTC